MTDIKKVPSSRVQVANAFLKATETNDKAAFKRLLADTYTRTIVPFERADAPAHTKKAGFEDYRDTEVTAEDVLETVDGKVVMHVRWKGLRNDGQWVQRDDIRIISFTDGPSPFDDPQIVHIKFFIDWVGMTQWVNPKSAKNLSVGAMYDHIMGLDQVQTAPGSGGKCIVM